MRIYPLKSYMQKVMYKIIFTSYHCLNIESCGGKKTFQKQKVAAQRAAGDRASGGLLAHARGLATRIQFSGRPLAAIPAIDLLSTPSLYPAGDHRDPRDSDFLFTRLSPPLFISNFHFPVLSFIIFSFSFFPEFIEDVIYIGYMYNLSFRL